MKKDETKMTAQEARDNAITAGVAQIVAAVNDYEARYKYPAGSKVTREAISLLHLAGIASKHLAERRRAEELAHAQMMVGCTELELHDIRKATTSKKLSEYREWLW